MNYQTALITGASSGLGRSLAVALAKRGTRIIACARRKPELDSLVDEIKSHGGRADAVVLDVAQADAAYEAVRALDDEHSFDLVIANAGVSGVWHATKLDWKYTHRILDVNLAGACATLAGVLPGMVARNHGHLVGMASLSAYRGLPGFAAYSASKAGLVAFLESLRVDLRETNVRVTALCPGFVRTEATASVDKALMPFVIDCDVATKAIMRGLDRQKSIVAFPFPVATFMRLMRVLPASLFDLFIRRTKHPESGVELVSFEREARKVAP